MTDESDKQTSSNQRLRKLLQDMAGSGVSGAVLRGSVAAFVVKCFGLLSGFLLSLVLTRSLGADGFGVYSLAIGWILICAVPMQSGLVGVVVREIPRYRTTGDWKSIRGLLIFSNTTCFVSSIIAAGFMLVLWVFISEDWGFSKAIISWMILIVPIYCLSSLRSGVLRGFSLIMKGLFPEQILRPLIQVALVLGLLFVIGAEISPSEALAAHFAAVVIAFGFGFVLLQRALPKEVKVAEPEFELKKWLFPIFTFALVSGFGSLMQSAVLIVLGSRSSVDQVGYLKVAQQLAALSGIVVLAVNSAAAPHIASLFRTQKMSELKNLLKRFAKIMFVSTLPLGVIFLLLGDAILIVLFGEEFHLASGALAVLVAGQMMVASLGLVGLTLNMSGHEKDTLWVCIAAMIMTVGLAYFFSRDYGATGGASSIVVGQIFMQLLLVWRVSKRLGISISVLGRKKNAG